jgi:lipopolysaccharide biosynthesis regulator YciM
MSQDIQRASLAYQKAIKMDSSNVDAHYNLGQLYLDNGMREDGDKVMEIYQRLITEKETEREQAAPKEK